MINGVSATPPGVFSGAAFPLDRASPAQPQQPAARNEPSRPASATQTPDAAARTAPSEDTNAEGLTEEEERTVRELKKRDAEVRAHEQAHKTVGGPYAGTISFDTVTGPDGRQYAVGGEVGIDASAVPNNPEATIRKMEIVIRAALAPADPSPQDFAVAQAAQQTKLQAQAELRKQRAEEQNGEDGDDATGLRAQLDEVTRREDENAAAPVTTSPVDAARAFIEAGRAGRADQTRLTGIDITA